MQIAILSAFSALALRLTELNATRADNEQYDDRGEDLVGLREIMVERIARLKALDAAGAEFCAGFGVSATDIDTMLGQPVMGRVGKLEMIEAILGDVDPDEDHQRACLALMTRLWKTKIRQR